MFTSLKTSGSNLLKRPRSFSKKEMVLSAAIFAAVGGYGIWWAVASPSVVAKYEVDKMSLPPGAVTIKDRSASHNLAVGLTQNGDVSQSVSLSRNAESLTVMARGDHCGGNWPKMQVSIDDKNLSSITVDKNRWRGYSITTAVSSGQHSIKISLSNAQSNIDCVRTLYLDKITFYGNKSQPKPTPPTPPGTTTTTLNLSANPTSIKPGEASTLIWSSTSATTCSASGAWTGVKAPSSTESTGPLTTSKEYTLTCTGGGGSIARSVTVKVEAPPPPAPPPPPASAPSPTSSAVVAGSTITVTNATWRCNKPLSSYGKLPIKVTQTWSNAASSADSIKDSIWLEKGCTGDTNPNTIDLVLDVQGNGGSSGTADDAITLKHGAHDIQISGHFECGARQGGAHQDGVQMNGAERIKFIGVTSGNVSDPNPAKWTPTCHGAGGLFYVSELNDNDALLVDVVCEGCKMAAVNAGLSIYGSTRSGAINSTFTGRRPCYVSSAANNSPTAPVNSNNTCTDTG